jgi:hypothetical protein
MKTSRLTPEIVIGLTLAAIAIAFGMMYGPSILVLFSLTALVVVTLFAGAAWFFWFRDSPVPTETVLVTDPLFGQMEQVDDDPPVWISHEVDFAPGIPTITLCLPGDDTGPSQGARDLFVDLRRRFPDVWPTIRNRLLLRRGVRERYSDNDDEGFVCLWTLTGVVIREAEKESEIDLAFRFRHDPEHTYHYELRD